MSSKILTDLTLCLHAETDKAILVSDTGVAARAVWLPKSQIEIEQTGKFTYAENRIGAKKYPVVIVTLPEWIAIDKGLA